MNSLSIPQKYVFDTLKHIKEIFPLTYRMYSQNNYENSENEFIIDEYTNEIIGIIIWEHDHGYPERFVVINSFEININHRSKGIGSQILEEFVKDKERIFLHYKDEQAKRFYIKNGFREIVNVPGYVYYKKEI